MPFTRSIGTLRIYRHIHYLHSEDAWAADERKFMPDLNNAEMQMMCIHKLLRHHLKDEPASVFIHKSI